MPVIQEVTARPLLLQPEGANYMQAALEAISGHEHAQVLMGHQQRMTLDDDFWGDPEDEDDWMHYIRPYNVKDGILQIPVMGMLLNRFPYQFGRWATGYTYIEKAMERGLEDQNVSGIALVFDSRGGEVSGCFELTDRIYEARGEKQIRAFASDSCYSAAYCLASAADSISVTRSGGVGSIGVMAAHIEFSEMMEKAGVKVTLIYAGKHKVDGNQYQALSPAALERYQASIDKSYTVFTSTVARNRGMDVEDVRATEAQCYDSDESLEVGLADRVGALEDEMAIYAADLEQGSETMATPNAKKTGDDDTVSRAEADSMAAEAKAEGIAEGTKAANDRMNTILGSDAAKTRPKAALRAVKTSMSAEEAVEFLADLADETTTTAAAGGGDEEEGKDGDDAAAKKTGKKAGRNHFEETMQTGNPDVGGGEEGDGQDAKSPEAQSNTILNDLARASGATRKAKA